MRISLFSFVVYADSCPWQKRQQKELFETGFQVVEAQSSLLLGGGDKSN